MVVKTFREEPVLGNHETVELNFCTVEIDGRKVTTKSVVDKRRPRSSDDAEESYYRRYIAKEGQLFACAKGNGDVYSIRFYDDCHVMEVTSIKDEGRRLRINLPEGLQNTCTCVTEDNGLIIIDGISNSCLIYTFILPFSMFTKGGPIPETADMFFWQEDYAIRSRKPFFLQPLKGKADELVLSFCDGGLMKLERSNNQFFNSLFSDTSYMKSLKSMIFSHGKIPSMPHLSTSAVISMTHFGQYLVTVSVNQTLKVWDLRTLGAVSQTKLGTEKTQYDTEPATRVCTSGEYCVTFCGGEIQFWNDAFKNIFTTSVTDTGLWSLKDMALKQVDNSFELSTVWTSGVSFVVKKTLIDLAGTVEWAECGQKQRGFSPVTVHDYERSGSLYSEPLLKTALAIYTSHFGQGGTINEAISSQLRLNFSIDGVHADYESYARDELAQWSKFDHLCQELSRQGNGCIGSSLTGPQIFILTGTGLTTVRQSTELEQLYDNRGIDGPDLAKLVFVMDRFTNNLPYSVTKMAIASLEEDFLAHPHHSEDVRMDTMGEQLAQFVPKTAFHELCEGLNEIINIDQALDSLAELMQSSGGAIDTVYLMCLQTLLVLLVIHVNDIVETDDGVVDFAQFLVFFRTYTIARECAFQRGERNASLGDTSEEGFYQMLSQLPVNRAAKLARFLAADPVSTFVKAVVLLRNGDARKAKRCFSQGAIPSENTLSQFELPRAKNSSDYNDFVSNIFANAGVYDLAVTFAQRVITPDERSLVHKFKTSLKARDYDVAYYTAVCELSHREYIAQLVLDMAKFSPRRLLDFAFIGHHSLVDTTLASFSGPNKYKLLYGWRISRHDFRGAACALYEQLLGVKEEVDTRMSERKAHVSELYMSILNVLSFLGQDDAWYVCNGKAFTLEDVEREHQLWLDGLVREMTLALR